MTGLPNIRENILCESGLNILSHPFKRMYSPIARGNVPPSKQAQLALYLIHALPLVPSGIAVKSDCLGVSDCHACELPCIAETSAVGKVARVKRSRNAAQGDAMDNTLSWSPGVSGGREHDVLDEAAGIHGVPEERPGCGTDETGRGEHEDREAEKKPVRIDLACAAGAAARGVTSGPNAAEVEVGPHLLAGTFEPSFRQAIYPVSLGEKAVDEGVKDFTRRETGNESTDGLRHGVVAGLERIAERGSARACMRMTSCTDISQLRMRRVSMDGGLQSRKRSRPYEWHR